MYQTKKIASLLIFFGIIIFAFLLRTPTFNLPHFRGDEHHYISLAFKLETQGIDGYNLRGVDIYSAKGYPELLTIVPAKDKGHILKGLEQIGVTYYDEPLHHMPWGFPAALIISHKIFARNEPYRMLTANDMEIIKQNPPGVGLRNFRFPKEIVNQQFYALFLPLFFSLATIALIYFIVMNLYNDKWVAFTAMFLMAISPIDLLTSQKIWADEQTLFFAVLAIFLYILSVKKNISLLAFLAGISCGISTITKQNGGAIAGLAIILWHIVSNADNLFKKETCLKTIFDKKLILFFLGTFLSAGYWFYKVIKIYGEPLYRPRQENLLESAKIGWFKIVQSRPKYLYLVGIPYQNPLFLLAYISPIWLYLNKKLFKSHCMPVLWLAGAFYLASKFFTGEHRYMITAYPAFAMLSAFVSNRMRLWIDNFMGYKTGTVLFFSILIFSIFWSVPMAYETLYHVGALILKPF
ncbi:membrane protein containing Glycosyl transferase, family 39 domain protein [Candidatus Omnitrophus magneticus]|uniref:Membrane protein containing Glycosyl transferase, family 39 domain protein n=1 Tax=Candidatus Omnitrophus magneticus TaxID=1609969 RepID=A0A0F0CUY7_9BACT|nr:membrane protein containing Glycosyl transferase, family 39 domain protein [Candidatus Omnitrophus magneticus]